MSCLACATAGGGPKVAPRQGYGPEKRRDSGSAPLPPEKKPDHGAGRGRRVPSESSGHVSRRADKRSRDSLTKVRSIGDAVERAKTDAERSVSRSAKRLALELDVRAREAAERFAAGASDSAVNSVLPSCFAEEILLFDGWRKRIDEFWRESAGEWSTVDSERDAELARIKRIFEECETSDADTDDDDARRPEARAKRRMDLPRPELDAERDELSLACSAHDEVEEDEEEG